jgi:hypothetical protein
LWLDVLPCGNALLLPILLTLTAMGALLSLLLLLLLAALLPA